MSIISKLEQHLQDIQNEVDKNGVSTLSTDAIQAYALLAIAWAIKTK